MRFAAAITTNAEICALNAAATITINAENHPMWTVFYSMSVHQSNKRSDKLSVSLILLFKWQWWLLKLLKQWFLTLLEVLNLTSSIHAFIEPFVAEKNKVCVLNFIFIAQNHLLPNT